MVFDYSKNHLIVGLTSQKYYSKPLIQNTNLGLVKKYTAQSQWIGSKQLVQNEWEVFLMFVQNGYFLPIFLVKKLKILVVFICVRFCHHRISCNNINVVIKRGGCTGVVVV